MRMITSMRNVHSQDFEDLFSRLAFVNECPSPKLAWMAKTYIFTGREYCEAFGLRCKPSNRPAKMKWFVDRGVIAIYKQGDYTHPTLYIWKGGTSCHLRKSVPTSTKVQADVLSPRSKSKHIMPLEAPSKAPQRKESDDE